MATPFATSAPVRRAAASTTEFRRDRSRLGNATHRGIDPGSPWAWCSHRSRLAGCFTGQRPSFEPTEPSLEPTGNADIDAVLERLDSVSECACSPRTTTILTKLGNVTSTATVVQARPGSPLDHDQQRAVPLRRRLRRHLQPDHRGMRGDDQRRPGQRRVGQPRVLRQELRPAPARRCRPAGRRSTRATRSRRPVNKRCASTCRSPAEPTATARSSNGVLARYDGNDLFIEMTAYSEFADETAFETSLPETTSHLRTAAPTGPTRVQTSSCHTLIRA